MSIEMIKQNAQNLLEVSEKYEEAKKTKNKEQISKTGNYILKLIANIEKLLNKENV